VDPAVVPSSLDFSVILVAPNVSEQMGGEAIKALQIYRELRRQGVVVHQITHERVRPELDAKFPDMNVTYVSDGPIQRWVSRLPLLAAINNMIFQWKAVREIRRLLNGRGNTLVHYTSPVSPILPYFRTPGAAVVIGPINGNIHYPPAFRHREPASYRVRRLLHPITQFLHRLFFSGKQTADVLLVAGGERTYRSLRMAGCRDRQFVESIDSGVLERLGELPRATHSGRNLRFVHNGRLVVHKGTDLLIRAVARTRLPVELDIIGRGPALAGLKHLVAQLNLGNRVKFIEWFKDHNRLAETLQTYRAFVFPSLAEANGIVVQEAMVIGLPVICADWGGPALLVTPQTGIAIEPRSEEYLIESLANAMDKLADDGEQAERFSIRARQRAMEQHYLWPDIVRGWMAVYRQAMQRHAGSPPVAAPAPRADVAA
jgi:glycosyltransferase involved in cell wall biosynthesis